MIYAWTALKYECMTFYLKSKNRIFFSLLKHAITPAKLSVAVHLHIM